MATTSKEFIFVDESGDPGFGTGSQPFYLLVAMHCSHEALDDVRRHLASFRYHQNVRREFKDQKWADKSSGPTLRLLDFLADLTRDGRLATTCSWLEKSKYQKAGGPHVASSWRFRHYQIRRLLEAHISRQPWGENLELVIDRWQATHEQQADLFQYLRNNYQLRPQIANLTMVDSLYADPIQVADILTRLARRIISGNASDEDNRLAAQLLDLVEIEGGLF